MNLSKMTKEELETLSYADLTEMILKEEKNSLNTPSIFKKICKLLELSDDEYASQIGDFYTSLTTDKPANTVIASLKFFSSTSSVIITSSAIPLFLLF